MNHTAYSDFTLNQLLIMIFFLQIAPEEFSLEDVRHLQKLIRDLHAENIQKTLSYIKLEQAYYSMKG
jgi:hypothetical protein